MDASLDACEAALSIRNAWPEVERAAIWLEGFAVRTGVPADASAKLMVVLDEAMSNVMRHALPGVPAGGREILVKVRRLAGSVELEVIDDGAAFDPTRPAVLQRAKRIADRQEGDVGLLFIRTLMDDVRYVRQDGRNHFTMCKRLAIAA